MQTVAIQPFRKPVVREIELPLEGVHSNHCAAIIEKALRAVEGIKEIHVDYANQRLRAVTDSSVTVPKIVEIVRGLGYQVPVRKEAMDVGGMTCAGCASTVQSVLRALPEVLEANVNLATKSAWIEYVADPSAVTRMRSAVHDAGYELHVSDAPAREIREDRAMRDLRIRAAVASVVAIPTAVLTMFFHPLLPNFVAMMLSIPVMWAGRQFYINAWKQARHRSANMDTLVALSTAAAFAFSAWNTLWPEFMAARGLPADVYFESGMVIIAFILISRWLEDKAKRRAGNAIRNLMGLQPKTVRLQRDGAEIDVPIHEIREGDIVVLLPGQRVPVDGVVIAGESFIDESMITGEPMAAPKAMNDLMYAGTINQRGRLEARTTRTGSSTLLGQMIRMVEEAQGSKAPIQNLVDKVAAVFVPIVLVTAVISGFLWVWLGPDPALSRAVLAFVTVLIIACPCALGLATPTAIMVGIGRAAEKGILIKNADALERAMKISALIVDKTGTVTEGKPTVTDLLWEDETVESKYVAVWSSLERQSDHPVSHAVARFFAQNDAIPVGQFLTTPGKGIQGSVEGQEYFSGNLPWIQSQGISISDRLQTTVENWRQQGKTVIVFSDTKKTLAIAAVSDTVKAGSAEAIRDFQRMGIQIWMVTGDHEQSAQSIAQHVGIDRVAARALPQDKLDQVKRLQQEGHVVAMAGDGINDAGALAQADVGIAMGQGTDIAMEAASMTLMKSDLAHIRDAIFLSRKTVAAIRLNLFWAFVYNIVGIPIAAGVLYPAFILNPMMAGAAMALSSVSVVLNSLRLKRA